MPTPGNIKEESTSEQKRAKIQQNKLPKAKKNTSMLVFTSESQKKRGEYTTVVQLRNWSLSEPRRLI